MSVSVLLIISYLYNTGVYFYWNPFLVIFKW
jgi:hypothetical protein